LFAARADQLHVKKQKDQIDKLEKTRFSKLRKGWYWVYETHVDKVYLEILEENKTVPKAKKYLKNFWTLKTRLLMNIKGTRP